jgi:hypothetical protein
MSIDVITPPDSARFAYAVRGAEPCVEECRICWDPLRGSWRAFGEDGVEAWADDREHAALKVFAIRRYRRRPQVSAPPERTNKVALAPFYLLVAAMTFVLVVGLVTVAGWL